MGRACGHALLIIHNLFHCARVIASISRHFLRVFTVQHYALTFFSWFNQLHLQNGYIITDFSKDFLLLCSSSTHKYFRKASTCPAYIFFAYRVIDALTRQPSSRRSCTYGDVYQAWKPVPYTYLYLSAKILSGTICKHLSFCMPLNFK